MTAKEKQEAKESLKETIDRWLNQTQESDAPFDCWIGGATVALMTDAAFSVIESVEDAQQYLKSQGLLDS